MCAENKKEISHELDANENKKSKTIVKKTLSKSTKKVRKKTVSKTHSKNSKAVKLKSKSKTTVKAKNKSQKVGLIIPKKQIHSWMPKTKRDLKKMAKVLLGIDFPDKKICPHHDSPLDYLAASFLKQQDLLVWANRCGGKTMLAAAATIFDAIFRGPIKIRVLGGSFDQSARLGEYIREFVANRPDIVQGKIRRDTVRLVSGSEIKMLAQSQRAVRGQHVQKIRCDEVDLFDHEVWQAVQFSTRSEEKTRGSIEVLSTLHRAGGLMDDLVKQAKANRDNPDAGVAGYRLVNWCLWEVIERCPKKRKCSECLLWEDCQGVAKKARGFFKIDDAITIKARSSKAAWEAEMLCKGPQRQHLVFDEFDTNIHVKNVEYCPDFPTFRAIDFGYASPLSCLWVQLTPAGTVHVIDEYIRARLPVATHAQAMKAKDPGPVSATYVDPAGRQKESTSGAACTEILASAGIVCTSRPSFIADGLELLRSALKPAAGPPRLYINPRCRVLIDSFNTYHYPSPDAPGDPDKPVKDGPDHAIDALRYFFINKMRPGIETKRLKY